MAKESASPTDLNGENTETPPSLCRWIFERLTAAGVHPQVILDPCSGYGNLTRPFKPGPRVIEYEISLGEDFFKAERVSCDLVLCNPPWLEAERWLPHVVGVVGRHTPIVFFCPVLYFTGYKSAPFRQYLESANAPTLSHITPLTIDTFVGANGKGAILWLNLPEVQNVAFVPSRYLLRTNNFHPESHQWQAQ